MAGREGGVTTRETKAIRHGVYSAFARWSEAMDRATRRRDSRGILIGAGRLDALSHVLKIITRAEKML